MPRFSIVITTTRPDLVGNAIRSALAQDFEDFELIVSDNTDDGCKELVDGFADARIRHVRPPEKLDLVPHWNFAFSQAQGEWQLLLCDDDALAPNLLSVINRDIDEHPEVETISWRFGSFDHDGTAHGQNSLRFDVPGFSGKRTLMSSRELIGEMFDSGFGVIGSAKRKIPLIPFSAFSRKLMDKIRDAMNGELFLPICPMTSSTLAALALSDMTLKIDVPLTILGTPSDSQVTRVSDPATYEKYLEKQPFLYAPKDTSRFPRAAHTETVLRTQAALPRLLGDYELNWEKFFIVLFQDCISGHWDEDKPENLDRLERALERFPATLRARVHAQIASLEVTTAQRNSLMKMIQRKLHYTFGRIAGAVGYKKFSGGQSFDGKKLGLLDISDCARLLGQITGQKPLRG